MINLLNHRQNHCISKEKAFKTKTGFIGIQDWIVALHPLWVTAVQ
jgi:hypothetical protein